MDPSKLQLAIFADHEHDLWGVILAGANASIAIGTLQTGALTPEPVKLTEDSGTWLLEGADCELVVTPTPPSSRTPQDGAIEPCQLAGTLTLAGAKRPLQTPGVRGTAPQPAAGGSLRLFGSWFPAGQELGLLALRQPGAHSGVEDQISVTARGEEQPMVIDPRLSTTYSGAGEPIRIGLELWLGEAEPTDDAELLPRRVAGRASGSSASVGSLRSFAFECVTRGEPGAGVYVLATAPPGKALAA